MQRATELGEGQRRTIAELAQQRGLGNLDVIEAGEHSTNLPDACCDAIFMRNVLHHIDGWPAYLGTLAPALRPGGRVGIIGFSPAALWKDPDRLEIPARSADEPRTQLIGRIGDAVWSAFITQRSDRIRIISVRRARDEEKAAYLHVEE